MYSWYNGPLVTDMQQELLVVDRRLDLVCVVLLASESVAQVPDPASHRSSAGSFIVAVQLWRRQRLKQPTWKHKNTSGMKTPLHERTN